MHYRRKNPDMKTGADNLKLLYEQERTQKQGHVHSQLRDFEGQLQPQQRNSSVSLQVEGRSGEYWVDSKPSKSNAASHDVEAAKKLWDVSVDLTGAKFAF